MRTLSPFFIAISLTFPLLKVHSLIFVSYVLPPAIKICGISFITRKSSGIIEHFKLNGLVGAKCEYSKIDSILSRLEFP